MQGQEQKRGTYLGTPPAKKACVVPVAVTRSTSRSWRVGLVVFMGSSVVFVVALPRWGWDGMQSRHVRGTRRGTREGGLGWGSGRTRRPWPGSLSLCGCGCVSLCELERRGGAPGRMFWQTYGALPRREGSYVTRECTTGAPHEGASPWDQRGPTTGTHKGRRRRRRRGSRPAIAYATRSKCFA